MQNTTGFSMQLRERRGRFDIKAGHRLTLIVGGCVRSRDVDLQSAVVEKNMPKFRVDVCQ